MTEGGFVVIMTLSAVFGFFAVLYAWYLIDTAIDSKRSHEDDFCLLWDIEDWEIEVNKLYKGKGF